jgi:hypothetical protein
MHRPVAMISRPLPAAAAAVGIALAAGCETPAIHSGEVCHDLQRVAALPPQLREASGVTFSRSHAHVLWVHNDSEGTPSLYAIDTNGALLADIELPAAGSQADWEDIASGPCPQGECLYIGDVGDNLHDRDDRAILRLPEPNPRSAGTAGPVERFPVVYPDARRDAEAIFITADTVVFIISKGRSGPVTLYRYPPPFRPNERVVLEKVQELTPGLVQLPDLVTGAAAARGGELVAVRTYTRLQLYRFDGSRLTPLRDGPGFDLTSLAEPQGEGITLSDDGTVYLVSEAGLERGPAPLSRLTCPLP